MKNLREVLQETLQEAFTKKLLNNPKEGNTYGVKGTTTKGLEVTLKYARFVGQAKTSEGEWVYAFRNQETGGMFSFKKGEFQLRPPKWN